MLKSFPYKLWLGNYTLSQHQLTMTYGLDNMRFSCSYWYSGINLLELTQSYPQDLVEKLVFNIMCFEANKLCSLKPKYLDLGPLGRHWTPELEKLWREVFFRVWGQWRYQNDFPNYRGPQVLEPPQANPKVSAITIKQGTPKHLCFFGGGKDSLASTTLLDRMGQDYHLLTYTNSIYGSASKQISIIKGLIDQAVPKNCNYIYVYDDFVDCPILELENYGIKQLLAAETPSSIFSSLLLCLGRGYTEIWATRRAQTKDINHQWGKSTEAQLLLRNYIQQELISNITYFSILKSLYDIGIILISSTRQDVIHLTHSCNISKPWCKQCPKCCYMFGNANLIDMPENYLHWRQLLGLEKHTPFECVGGIEEVKICFQLLRLKGVQGKAMDDFLQLPKEDYVALFEKYSAIDSSYAGIPKEIRQAYLSHLQLIVSKQKQQLLTLLKPQQQQ